MELKIISFNTQHCLNYITRKIDYDNVANMLKDLGGDIIGLCEMRGEGPAEGYDEQVKILAEKLGYHYCFAPSIIIGGKNPYGNGLLSKYPITEWEKFPIPDPEVKNGTLLYETRSILKAKIDVLGGLNVFVSHFGLNHEEHLNAFETLKSNLTSEKTLFMGDLNMTPDNPVIKDIAAIIPDTASVFTEELLSFPSDTPKEKIDYMFATPDLKVTSADIPALTVSDHRPYVTVIEG